MKILAIYSGRFHPVHRGHLASFKQLAKTFGLENTFLAISSKQEQPDSPFSAKDRAKMAIVLGIPKDHILYASQPYSSEEYMKKFETMGYDPEHTIMIFGVSKKDMTEDPRFSFEPKKDGSPSYFQPYTGKRLKSVNKHAYIYATEIGEFPIAGRIMKDASVIRAAYSGANTHNKLRILTDLYGKAAQQMKPIFDNNLVVTENIKRLIKEIKPMLNEATFEQKVKFAKLLGEAKKTLLENLTPTLYKGGRDVDIIKDLGNGYFLSDETTEDEDRLVKQGWAVYHLEQEPDMYRFVDYVKVSPYPNNRKPGEIEQQVKQIISADKD